MKERFRVQVYKGLPIYMQDDMNSLAEQGYRPKEVKLNTYQNYVDAIIIYELESDPNDN